MRNVKWSDDLKTRLVKYWEEAKGDRDEFKKLVIADKALLEQKGWDRCRQKAKELGFFENAKPSKKKYPFAQLDEAKKQELLSLIVDGDIGWTDIFKKFPGFSELQFRNFAQAHSVSVNKGRESGMETVGGAQEQHQKPSTLDQRILDLINVGKLVELGAEGLFKIIDQEFTGQLTREAFDEKLSDLVWDSKTLGSLEEVVKRALPVDKFLIYHKCISLEMAAAKYKELTGISKVSHPVSFIPGMGRISGEKELKAVEEIELPRTSFSRPFLIPTGSEDRGSIAIMSGPNIGLRHDRRLGHNPLKRALIDAQRRGDVAVIISNPIDIDTKKAGGAAKVHRALVSGRNVNIKVLDPTYQERAKTILDDPDSEELVFETFAEVFENIMSGYWKITRKPDGSPEYSGEVRIAFGRNEDELIASAAYAAVRYKTIQRQIDLDVEIKMAKKALAHARDKKDDIASREFSKKLEQLLKEKSRTIVSNINTEAIQKAYRRVFSFVVRRFEETIPNCKVISKGSVYIKIGGKIIELHVPDHLRITDTLLARYADHYGPKVLRKQFANAVVICHPYALNYRMTVREVDAAGKRGQSAPIFVAPVIIDGEFLRDALRDTVRRIHPISKLVFQEQFRPGFLRLNWINDNISGEPVPINALPVVRISKHKENKQSSLLIGYPDSQRIWLMVGTDPHWGARSKEFIWCQKRQSNLGVCDAAIEMMRQSNLCDGSKLPIHMFTINDDPTQGNHYETHKQPDPHQAPYYLLEKHFAEVRRAAKKGGSADRLRTVDELERLTLDQLNVRGLDWLEHQLQEVIFRHIQPNVDFFDAVLSRAMQAGLIVKGVSDFEGTIFDKRDIGVINMGTGNHFSSTVEKTMTEGWIYALVASALLGTMPKWRKKQQLLQNLIRSPLHGNEFIGWGTIQVPNGYEWGVELRSAPARMSSWGDTLLGAVRNDERRGNYSRILEGKMSLKVYGDKHFFGAVSTDHTFYHMCASGTHTDSYGERGFPPNNTGVSFVGLPVKGPDSGPIIVRTLPYDQIKKYFDNPYKFDWVAFLPNPA